MAIPIKTRILTLLKLLTEPKVLKFLLSQRHSGYLFEQGWFNSFKTNSPVDKNNRPVPWMTYSFIDFIKNRLNKSLKIFEFGSGNSTLFFADKVNSIVAVEHNKEWFDLIKSKMPENVSILLKVLTEEYENSLNRSERFDIIIIDGERRLECIRNSVNCLSSSGVIILDDSERSEYKSGIEFLIKLGFKRIDFWGLAPGTFFNKCTTIFYKDKNSLTI